MSQKNRYRQHSQLLIRPLLSNSIFGKTPGNCCPSVDCFTIIWTVVLRGGKAGDNNYVKGSCTFSLQLHKYCHAPARAYCTRLHFNNHTLERAALLSILQVRLAWTQIRIDLALTVTSNITLTACHTSLLPSTKGSSSHPIVDEYCS